MEAPRCTRPRISRKKSFTRTASTLYCAHHLRRKVARAEHLGCEAGYWLRARAAALVLVTPRYYLIRAQRAKLKLRRSDMNVAQGKRGTSAALGKSVQTLF